MTDKYVFVGDRFPVLSKMIECGCLVVKVFAVSNSSLSRELDSRKYDYHPIESKKNLLSALKDTDYDILVSNGCPYILPISELDDGNKKFINLHPSLLPDLRGMSPINGAILFDHKHGVTCHFMDDGMDTGAIIAQKEIPIEENINLYLLYRLTFLMEGEVFEEALLNHFNPTKLNISDSKCISYKRTEEDMIIRETDDLNMVLRRIRAFNLAGKFAKIMHNEKLLRISECIVIDNPLFFDLFRNNSVYTVVDTYGDEYFLYKTKDKLLQFKTLDLGMIKKGEEITIGNQTF